MYLPTKPINGSGSDLISIEKPKSPYESLSFGRFCFNCLIAKLFTSLPVSISELILKKSSDQAAKVHRHAKTHKALDTMYDIGEKLHLTDGIVKNVIEHTWFNMTNPRAARNRLKLIKKLIKEEIIEHYDKTPDNLDILSIASGSSRAIIEAVNEVKQEGYDISKIKISLLDKNKAALDSSVSYLDKYKLGLRELCLINDKGRNFTNYFKDKKPDIIEVVGLFDYLNDEKANLLLKLIYNNIANGGVLLMGNIRTNRERKFVEKVMNWHMIYREPEDLKGIIGEAGFNTDKVKIYYEPLQIHGIIKAIK